MVKLFLLLYKQFISNGIEQKHVLIKAAFSRKPNAGFKPALGWYFLHNNRAKRFVERAKKYFLIFLTFILI